MGTRFWPDGQNDGGGGHGDPLLIVGGGAPSPCPLSLRERGQIDSGVRRNEGGALRGWAGKWAPDSGRTARMTALGMRYRGWLRSGFKIPAFAGMTAVGGGNDGVGAGWRWWGNGGGGGYDWGRGVRDVRDYGVYGASAGYADCS